MQAAMIDAEGMLIEVAFDDNKPAVLADDIVQVTDEQYKLLRSRRARWERGKGVVLVQRRDDAQGGLHAAKRFMIRDHRLRLDDDTYASPVRNRIHDLEADSILDPALVLTELLIRAGLRDGDEFEICVSPTGRRPHGDRYFLFSKNRPETDDEVLARIRAMDHIAGSTETNVILDMGRVEDGNEE